MTFATNITTYGKRQTLVPKSYLRQNEYTVNRGLYMGKKLSGQKSQ